MNETLRDHLGKLLKLCYFVTNLFSVGTIGFGPGFNPNPPTNKSR